MKTKLQLINCNGMYRIVDQNNTTVIENIYNADQVSGCEEIGVKAIIRFFTAEGEYSFITVSGFFFGEYSYKEFDMVCCLLPPYIDLPIYKIQKNGKFGVINSSCKTTLDCIYDEIEVLKSNQFTDDSLLIKLKLNKKYYLAYGYGDFKISLCYDYIFTPIQPLNMYIVKKNERYGLIDAYSFCEILPPEYDTIEDLCNERKLNILKYTLDIYRTATQLNIVIHKILNRCTAYYKDENKIVKGKWGGKKDRIINFRTREVYVYELYYKSLYLPINKYGYFYNLFDGKKYDVVIRQLNNLYLVKSKGRYGLIDEEFNYVLNPSYLKVQMVQFWEAKENPLFVVTSSRGQFLFNSETGRKTRTFKSLYWKSLITGHFKNYLVFGDNGKFGVLSPAGEILVEAKFDYYVVPFIDRDRVERGHAYFQEIFHEKTYMFYIEDAKFYGIIPLSKYDCCIRIGGHSLNSYFITRLNNKYGLLNHMEQEIFLPQFDDIIYPQDGCNTIFGCAKRQNKPLSATFMIGRVNDKYSLYSIESLFKSKTAKIIVDDCEEMEFIETKISVYSSARNFPFVRYKKSGMIGYVNENGMVFAPNSIKKINKENREYYYLYSNNKVGLLNSRLVILLLPCIYDDIIEIKDQSAIVIENGIKKEVEYRFNSCDNNSPNYGCQEDESSTYNQYIGSYAQDEMGYSDDDIDTIFDGDPSAYWNID